MKRYNSSLAHLLICFFCISSSAFSKTIQVNQVTFFDAPKWLTNEEVQSCVQKVENTLEWDLRKISVFYYSDSSEFNKKNNFKFPIDALFKKSDQSIHISPKVNKTQFKRVFSHELVHAIFFQKYRNAIPVWLEEGLANTLSDYPSPDYRWLNLQSWPPVSTLGHVNDRLANARTYYSVSTGLIEMIKAKCNLHDLLKLTVGSKLTHYLKTFCGIEDTDKDFRKWVAEKANQNDKLAPSPNLPWWKRPAKGQWWKTKE